jgi:hypothetical protein
VICITKGSISFELPAQNAFRVNTRIDIARDLRARGCTWSVTVPARRAPKGARGISAPPAFVAVWGLRGDGALLASALQSARLPSWRSGTNGGLAGGRIVPLNRGFIDLDRRKAVTRDTQRECALELSECFPARRGQPSPPS